MINIPDAALGAIAAATIAALISLLGLIISKEQKTSEFRQTWIDALRNDLTAYLTQINAIHDAIAVKYGTHAEKVETLRPLYLALNTSNFNILLRINPEESRCKELINAMTSFNSFTADESKLIASNIRATEAKFLKTSQALLKSEWSRVKSGELTFRIAKNLSLIIVISTFLFGFYIAFQPKVKANDPVKKAAVSCENTISSYTRQSS